MVLLMGGVQAAEAGMEGTEGPVMAASPPVVTVCTGVWGEMAEVTEAMMALRLASGVGSLLLESCTGTQAPNLSRWKK